MAYSQIPLDKGSVFVVPESAQDTFETPTDANVLLASDVAPSKPNAGTVFPAVVRPDFMRHHGSPGPRAFQLTFTLPLMGSGVVDQPPHIADVLKACGLFEAVSPGVAVTYRRGSTFDGVGGNPASSYSFGYIVDGKIQFAGFGGFGSAVFNADVNGIGTVAVTMQGAYVDPAATALLGTSGYDTTRAPGFRGAPISLTLTDPVLPLHTPIGVSQMQFDLANRLALGLDASKDDGFYGARITGGEPAGSFNPEDENPTDYDWHGLGKAAAVGSLSTGIVGSASWNKWAITCGVTLQDPTSEDRNRIAALQCPFRMTADNDAAEGDDFLLSFPA